MKKRIRFALCAVVLAVLGLILFWGAANVQAADGGAKQYVTDNADIFSEKEEQKLQKMCVEASNACKTDVAIITQSQGLDGKQLESSIRKIIETDYGYNPESTEPDAIVYVIDMRSRADMLVTSGNARTMESFTQERLDKIRESAEEKLADGEYYAGCKKFINGVRRQMDNSLMYKLTLYLPQKLLISLGIAVTAVLVMMYQAKAKMTVDSGTYTKDHQFDIRRREDHFVNTTVVTRHIESNNSSSGGSGSSGGGGNSGSSGGHF